MSSDLQKRQSMTSNSQPPVIFFDGVCGLCNSFVDWTISLGKPVEHFLFSPLQGSTALKTLDRSSIEDLSSVVVLLNGQFYRKSSAVLVIFKNCVGVEYLPLRLISGLLFVVPVGVRDWLYDQVAKRRYEFFGKRDNCRIPTPEERKRFLP